MMYLHNINICECAVFFKYYIVCIYMGAHGKFIREGPLYNQTPKSTLKRQFIVLQTTEYVRFSRYLFFVKLNSSRLFYHKLPTKRQLVDEFSY